MKSFSEHKLQTHFYEDDFVDLEEGKVVKADQSDPPMMMVMRRKWIRQFPNGQKVAMYYINNIDKYITVPYSDLQIGSGMHHEETTVLNKLQGITESGRGSKIVFEDGSQTFVRADVAKSVTKLYSDLNEENKEKFEEMLERSKDYFSKILDLASKHKG